MIKKISPRYYYVSWMGTRDGRAWSFGSQAFLFEDEFGIAFVQDLLSRHDNQNAIIVSWQEISERQFKEYADYCTFVNESKNNEKKLPRIRALKVVEPPPAKETPPPQEAPPNDLL